MNMKSNLLSNYAAQIYLIGVNYITLPYLFESVGANTYGLIGLFATMQAWFSVFDLGMLPALSRESNKYHAGAITALEFRQIFRVLLGVFFVIGMIGSGLLLLNADTIALKWIKNSELSNSDLIEIIRIISICVGLRWFGGIYKSLFLGAEKLLYLNLYLIVIATLRFIGVFSAMNFWGYDAKIYFQYQLIVALIELFSIMILSNLVLPKIKNNYQKIGWKIGKVIPVLSFALTIAFTSAVWIIVTQLDKLILSGILDIKEYGYLTIAIMLSNSINMLAGPLSTIIMSRLSALCAKNKDAEFIYFYRKSTKWMVLIAGTMGILLSFYPESWIKAWMGNAELSSQAIVAISLYSIGNAIISIGAFPYYMQYAKGNLKYHVGGNIVFAVLIVPTMIFASLRYGIVGAGMVWVLFNLLSLLFWQNYIHEKFISGFHWDWIFNDILKVLAPGLITAAFIYFMHVDVVTKLENISKLIISGLLISSSMIIFDLDFRSDVRKFLRIC